MKKFLALIIFFAFTALLAGCNDIKPSSNETTHDPSETSIPTETGEIEETNETETTAPETDFPETREAEGTDEPENNDPQNITVLSNEANLIFKEIVIPDAELKSIFEYNDRYSIVVTGDGKFTAAKNVKLYFIDKSEGKIVAETQLDDKYMPTDIQYTDDGAIIHHPVREIEGFTVSSAYQVKYANNQLEVTAVEIDKSPDKVAKIVSPDGQYTVYGVNDDFNGNGGIDIIYPNGSKKRAMEYLTFNEHGLREYSIYTPKCFVDNTRFIYSSSTGIGLYDISTGENITLVVIGEYRGYSDGYVYYYTHRKNYAAFDLWKCDISEEKVQIASVMAVDGLHVLNKYHTYYFMNGMWFAYHNTSLYSAELIDNEGATVSIYSEDMGKKLAALKYPYDSIHWPQLVMASDETVSVIVFDSTETETPETEAPETEAPETDAPETEPAVEVDPAFPVTVLSNPGGLDVNTVVIPAQINNHKAYAECIKYDDRYVLCLTHNYHYDEEARKSTRSNFRLYVVDTANGTIIHSQSLDCTGTPHELVYTSDGRAVLANMQNTDGILTFVCAHAIEISDGVVTLTDTDIEYFPHYENKVTSPDGKYTAYYVLDDTDGHGGIELHRIDGSVKRIRENYVVLSGENISSDVYGCLKSYSPVGFLDAKHLVIYVGHYESAGTYEIYNVETGETISRDQPDFITGDDGGQYEVRYSPMMIVDGWMYLANSELRNENGMFERCGVSKIDVGGNLVKIAHKYDKEGVFALPNELVWLNNGGSTWEMYNNNYNGWSLERKEYFESMNYRIRKTIYSADFELLLEIEYPFFYGSQMEDIYTYGNSCTVITFADGYPLE